VMASMVSNSERDGGIQVSTLESAASNLASVGDLLRRCRVKLDAAQRDVAEGASTTHTTLGELESGCAASDRHVPRIKRALLRIAVQRLKASTEVIEELIA